MSRLTRTFLLLLALAQAVAGLRVAARLLRTARGTRIAPAQEPMPGERVSVIVPVLNERERLAPCLASLIAQPEDVAEILIVDGGSTDGTPGLVRQFAEHDRRVRLIDASPVPPDWNGKAHGLQTGLRAAAPSSPWLLTIDADVRVKPALARALLAHARSPELAALGVATRQQVTSPGDAILHPALLTTLVYRFGIPGQTTGRVAEVQANGQCSLYQREALEAIGGFALARSSRCEDVTIARALAEAGHLTGFCETDDLAQAAMYASWRDTWRNWPRSLPLRDRYAGAAGWLGLVEVTLAQGLPLAVLAVLAARRAAGPGRTHALLRLQLALLALRLGVLVGTRRAYNDPPATYWLSPLADFPVSLRLWQSALQRQHTWRGRPLVPDTPDIWSMT